MTKRLTISETLALPLSFTTKTAAILAQRRKGKTYAASVIAEELVAAKQPFVALDPTGAWWGLRASADGKDAGLPVVILGGQHGDVALERTGGKLVAELVVDEPGYYVIDFSLFESGEAERQFATDFAERLYRYKGQPGKDGALHLFVDEADRFVPQQLRKGSGETSPRLLGAFEAIVRRGGLRGLGTTLISQRAAVVNKNVLEMLDVLIALRTVGPNDRKALDGYVQAHGTDEERQALQASLASLAIGEAWVWEPGADPPIFQRVQIRPRRTFNSSATPDPGKARVEPRQLAAVDLATIGRRMAETIERAKQDDPRELRKTIADKDKRIKELETRPAAAKQSAKQEVPALTDADRELLKALRADLQAFGEDIAAKADHVLAGIAERAKAEIDTTVTKWTADVDKRRALWLEQFGKARLLRVLDKIDQAAPVASMTIHPQTVAPATRRALSAVAQALVAQPPASTNGADNGTLPVGERAVLIAALQFNGIERTALTVLTGYSRSTRNTYIQRLAQRGYVTLAGDVVNATAEGLTALGDYQPLPTGDGLREHWLRELPAGERAILAELARVYPLTVARDDLSVATGFTRSTRNTYLQRMAVKRIVVDAGGGRVSAAKELFS